MARVTHTQASRSNIRARFAFLLALLLPLSSAFLSAPASASASELVDLSCVGTSSITFSPGLTNTPQPVTITSVNEFPHCTSLTDPEIKSAGFTAVVSATRSCTDLLNSGSGSRTITYNTGNTTTYTSTVTANYAAGQLVVADLGTVTGGQFLNSAFASQAVYVTDFTDCTTPQGLTNISGSFVITIGL